MMYELVYCSAANSDLSETEIGNILRTSRTYNKQHGITGCLLFYKNEFIQFLEGDSAVVKDLYAKIARDKRHFHVVLITAGEKEKRLFANWNMAYHAIINSDIGYIEKLLFINNFLTLLEFVDKPTMVIKLFAHLATNLLLEL